MPYDFDSASGNGGNPFGPPPERGGAFTGCLTAILILTALGFLVWLATTGISFLFREP